MAYVTRFLLLTLTFSATAQTPAPTTVEEWLDLADSYYYDWDYNAALQKIEQALILDSGNLSALHARARCAALLGEWELATQTIQKVESIEPIVPSDTEYCPPLYINCDNPKAQQHLKLGLLFNFNEDYVDAIEQYTFALNLCPQSQWLYALRAEAYAINQDTDAALRDVNRAFALEPDFIWPYLVRAKEISWDDNEALQDLNTVLERYPDHVTALTTRAYIYSCLENYTASITDYNKAIQLDPKNADAYANLGYYVKFLGVDDNQGALQDLNSAIQLDPQNSEFYYYRANVNRYVLQFQPALEDIDQAIALNPDDDWSYVMRGYIRSKLNDKTGALEDFNTVIERSPYFAWAYAERGTLYLTQGRFFEAIPDLFYAQEKNGFEISDPMPVIGIIIISLCILLFLTVCIFMVVIFLLKRRYRNNRRKSVIPPPIPMQG